MASECMGKHLPRADVFSCTTKIKRPESEQRHVPITSIDYTVGSLFHPYRTPKCFSKRCLWPLMALLSKLMPHMERKARLALLLDGICAVLGPLYDR